jgi:phosphate transport system protein
MTERHTLRVFDEDLKAISDEIIVLARQVADEMTHALHALMNFDHAAARAVVESDRNADVLLDRINQHTTRTLARQQALAGDLRTILAAARIGPHLERIGDYAKNMAKRTQRLSSPLDAEIAAQFHWMGTRIQSMLSRVTQAYEQRDPQLANVAWADDAELDAVYAKLFEHLLQHMRADTQRIVDGTQLMFIAKGLERAGDHVTDIAEEVYLMVMGSPLQGPRPKVDETGNRQPE